MRTNVVIDDQLIKTALELSGLRTKKDAIEACLRLLVQFKRQADKRFSRQIKMDG